MAVDPGAFAHAPYPLTFDFRSTSVRIVVIDEQPWFVGKDVADVLGYADSKSAIKQHCKGAVKHHPLPTAGGLQRIRILSEADMLRLIVSSKLPAAEVFERWVFEEVLPSIRKTGRYESAAQPSAPDRIDPRTLLLSEQSNLKTELPPKVADAVDRRAWELAREAYELTREHLRRRIAFRAAGGNPMVVNEQKALKVIMEGDLGDALAHGYHFKISCIERFVGFGLQTMNELAADIRESKQRLLRPQSPTENRL